MSDFNKHVIFALGEMNCKDIKQDSRTETLYYAQLPGENGRSSVPITLEFCHSLPVKDHEMFIDALFVACGEEPVYLYDRKTDNYKGDCTPGSEAIYATLGATKEQWLEAYFMSKGGSDEA